MYLISSGTHKKSVLLNPAVLLLKLESTWNWSNCETFDLSLFFFPLRLPVLNLGDSSQHSTVRKSFLSILSSCRLSALTVQTTETGSIALGSCLAALLHWAVGKVLLAPASVEDLPRIATLLGSERRVWWLRWQQSRQSLAAGAGERETIVLFNPW